MPATYDDVILHPTLRAYFGRGGYYNVGYWTNGCRSQEEACAQLVERIVSPVTGGIRTAIDAGCGLGASTRAIRKLWPGSLVIGVNNSLRQLDEARGEGFVAADAARLAIQNGSVAAIVSVEAAFHFRTREKFFREAAAALRSGGHLLMSDIIFSGELWPGGWTIPEENDLREIAAYRRTLERAGFTEIAIEDATAECWNAFCDRFRAWVEVREGIPTAPWIEMIDRLRHHSVRHYILVSAKVAH